MGITVQFLKWKLSKQQQFDNNPVNSASNCKAKGFMRPPLSVRSVTTLLTALMLSASAFAQDVRINEFMASNTRTLQDEDREFSDWIEIFNAGTNVVNLQNWGLSDDRSRPFRWRFPETNLNAGASMIVFASGKDRSIAGLPLHTDFKLQAGGNPGDRYLALTRPDGATASEFDPYPTQAPDVSYGLGQLTTNITVIATNASVRVRVPTSDADGTNWTTLAYDDTGWQSGTNGVGFGDPSLTEIDYAASVQPTAPVGYWRFNEIDGTIAENIGSGAALDGTANAATVLGGAGPRSPQFAGFETNNNAATFNGSSTFVRVNNSVLNGRNSFTLAGWIKCTVAPGNRVGLFGQNDCVEFGFISPGTLQCWSFNPPTGGGFVNATFNPVLNTWYHIAAVGDGTNIRIYTNGVIAATGGAATTTYGSSADTFNVGGGGIFDIPSVNGNWFNGQIDEVAVFHRALSAVEVRSLYSGGTNAAGFSVVPFVKTDIGASMSNINASAQIRLPFVISNPTNVALLTLRMRYDDGFFAFINGIPVQAANAPDPLLYNSAATDKHSPGTVEEFRLGTGSLTPGNNVLAIQGLNVSADNPDFLIVAELVATTVAASSDIPLYFTRATPGTPNSGGVAIVGPAILDPEHTPNVPKDNEDILVTVRVAETFYPVTNVVMRYRIMFNAEIEQQMFDDGLHGDGAAGDGVYGASIAPSASGPSQMVRWFFRARDNRGNTSRFPLFVDPANTAEYLGTMVDYQVDSKLPVIHLFAPTTVLGPGPTTTTSGADSQTGGRVSLFYDGEFYDNILMQLRGNTTAGYNKKSHRVEFNNEHQFRHSPDFPRVGKTSFVADYPDPAYMRQGLCYWLGNLIGSPGSFYNPVRLQLNGVFYQLANHNDVQDEDLLERLGFDPNGALYNAAGQVTPGRASTGGFEKKTRRWDNDNDYLTLSTGISETNSSLAIRRINVYDLFDLPNVINYLVIGRWGHENDDVWANMSLYHDNDGDNLWRIIGFDMNLSWGAIYYEGGAACMQFVEGVQSTNDMHKAHPLYGSGETLPCGSGNYNRVYDVIFKIPEAREMFLRRMRTMMDAYVKPPGLHPLEYPMETRVRALRDIMFDEAERDRNFWGWPVKGGQCNFDPGIRFGPGVDALLSQFIARRRQHFYGRHCITNASPAFPLGITKTNNAGIPLEQPADAIIGVSTVEYNPGSGNQLHEYLTVTNPNPYAVDISDWTLSGGVEFTFAKGTVIPSNGLLYVSPDVRAFKARPVAPRGGMGLFIVGPYKGQLSARGEPLIISNTLGTLIYSNTYAGSPSAAQQYLRITEIMYNPSLMPGQLIDPQEFEYIELKNISATETLNLTGVRLTEGVTFNFTGSAVTSLAPGARVLVVKNTTAFESRYGAGLPIAGQYVGNLDNSGDRIKLVDATNEEIHDFDYEDDWYPITDGGGFSLAIINENADPGLWDSKLNWRPSGQENGAPGQGETPPATFAPILVNEALTHTDPPMVDTIELFNPTDQAVDIGGWFLTDDFSEAKKFRIPNGTIIAAGGYLTFDEDDFNPGGMGFALSSTDDEVYLFSGDANTNLTGYFHGFSFGAAENGVSFGRHVNSVGDVHFVAQTATTLPGANSGPRIGPVIISEFLYRPADLPGGRDNSQDEYIELRNISAGDVPLFDTENPQNTWRLRGGVEFDFPTGVTMSGGGLVLVANFDVSDSGLLNAFRQKFNVPEGVPIFGPYRGQLNNNEDEIELKKPDTQLFDGTVPYVMVEQVDYRDESPWPPTADGTGASLHRLTSSSYANDPASWVAAAPGAGRAYLSGPVPVISVQPADQDALASGGAGFSVVASGGNPLSYQWRFNGKDIPGATGATLTLEDIQMDQAGAYNVTVLNSSGAATSSNAMLRVHLGVLILAHPQSTNVREGSNTVLSVSVYTNAPPVSFQWQFNGVNIPGATGTTLAINGAREADDGMYRVIVSDSVGSVASRPARVAVHVLATMIAPVPALTNITAVAGQTMTFSAQLRGTLPIWTRWRIVRNSGGNIILTPDQTNTQHFVTKRWTLQANDSGTVRVTVTNIAGGSLSLAATNAFITVLADTDLDGVPDEYEIANGMDKDVKDADGDIDHDTMKNGDEYIAGTDPRDPSSYLKIDRVEVGGPATISFLAVSNRSYTVQYSDTLVVPPIWTKVGDVLAVSTNRQASLVDPESNPKRFYRLVTPVQP
jgi:concanavalin A-like lectin/glucanase superfamily protein/CotH protein/lamin tail-like protein/Ig-like domain-containing protein